MQVWHIPNYWETLAFRKDSFRRLRQCAEVDVPKAYRLPSAKKGSEFESLMPVNESRLQAGVDHRAHLPNQWELGKTHGSRGIS